MSRIETCRSEAFRKLCSDRMKERHRLGLAKTFQNRSKAKHSYPEEWFIGFLKNEFGYTENKEYKTEFPFYRFFLDFAWPEKRLCIEIDGNLHRLEAQKSRDREKDKLLYDDGWQLLRLKWSYILKNKDLIKSIVEKFLNMNGDISIPIWKSKIEVLEEKHKIWDENGIKRDSIGRYNTRIIREDEFIKRKNLILASNVNLSKFGWVSKVTERTGLSRRVINEVINHFPDLKEKVFYREYKQRGGHEFEPRMPLT